LNIRFLVNGDSRYQTHALILKTDETFLARDNVGRFLRGATFSTRSITDVLLGLSYHQGTYPVFELQLTNSRDGKRA